MPGKWNWTSPGPISASGGIFQIFLACHLTLCWWVDLTRLLKASARPGWGLLDVAVGQLSDVIVATARGSSRSLHLEPMESNLMSWLLADATNASQAFNVGETTDHRLGGVEAVSRRLDALRSSSAMLDDSQQDHHSKVADVDRPC